MQNSQRKNWKGEGDGKGKDSEYDEKTAYGDRDSRDAKDTEKLK